MPKNTFTVLLFFGCFIKLSACRTQPTSGKCQAFKWGGGGSSGGSSSSGLHWYACCNNCQDEDSWCDRQTYQSASSGKYCGHCGLDIGPKTPENLGSEFYCGLCEGQRKVSKHCLYDGHRQVFYDVPGFCWAFTGCFRDFCRSRYHRKRSANPLPETCYNFRCDHEETVQNCPVDCCATVNPNKCTWKNGTCIPLCCSETTCCNGQVGGQSSVFSSIIAVGISLQLLIKSFFI